MNTEQELEAFEAWWEKEGRYCRAGGGDYEKTFAYRAYQAGRAALQSQDREDAERYRAWRKAVASQNGNFLRLVSNELPDWDKGPVDEGKIDAAIDHARRIEGNE